MLTAARQRKMSARYYLFEDVLWEAPSFTHLRKRQSIPNLQLLAGLVWAREGGIGTCPVVRSKGKNDYSYFMDRTIHLARKHRSLGGLLHEIAHALGPNDKLAHGPAFRRRCIRLYKVYGEWSGDVDWDVQR
jgi:hypothetical protein